MNLKKIPTAKMWKDNAGRILGTYAFWGKREIPRQNDYIIYRQKYGLLITFIAKTRQALAKVTRYSVNRIGWELIGRG